MSSKIIQFAPQFAPWLWEGDIKDFPENDLFPWINKIKNKSIYCYFWPSWDNNNNMPPNYEYYIILYHEETLINIDWLEKQRSLCDGIFIVLHNGFSYNYELENCYFLQYMNWHKSLEMVRKWWGDQEPNFDNKKYKFSAVCNRLEQMKIFVITKLLEDAYDNSLLVLGDWLEEKNVNYWLPLSDNPELLSLTNIFRKKYLGKRIVDSKTKIKINNQRYNSNPYQPIYADAALHFSLNNFSLSQFDNYIHPGPEIDEKIFKCLIGGVAFIPCAQFETLKSLKKLGFVFDYNHIDLSFDTTLPDDERFVKICNEIDKLNNLEIVDIMSDTKKSTLENWKYITKGGFFDTCEKNNNITEEKIFDIINGRTY